eukprot:3585956-Pleurochrysis_carterae.AAC.1
MNAALAREIARPVGLMEPLRSAKNATVPLELLVHDKADNSANYAKLIEAVKSSHAGVSGASV